MAASLLPGWALAATDAPVSGGQSINEYIEVTEADALEPGGTYAIAAPNAKHSILYHTHNNAHQADQVNAKKVIGNKLFLDMGYPEGNQLWTITGNAADGYAVESNAQDDAHYLHIDGTTLPGSERIPVDDGAQALTFEKGENGWVISRVIDGVTHYLSHGEGLQYYVSTDTPTQFLIYKQVATTLYVPEVPGYTLVTDATGAQLHDDQYYMFVGKGANGKMYALLPGDGTNPTDAPQPNLTAELTVSADGTSFTAQRVSDNTPVDPGDLLFRTFHYTGGSDTFASAKKTGRLLSLRDYMFTNVAGSIAVTVGPYGRVTLHAGNGRYLGLNINGDSTSSLQDQATGFYGPTMADSCPIYLFTKNDASIPEIDLTIPGYNRITSTTQLEIGSEYMIVSADSYGDLYALYPDPAGVNMLPGDGIDPAYDGYTPVTAQLTVDRAAGTVTAARLKGDGTPEGTALDSMGPLHFTVGRTGNTFTVKYSDDLYLAMVDAHFFTETPTELSITPDTTASTIYPHDGKFLVKDLHSGRNNARILDFNVTGDPIQYVDNDNNTVNTFLTNFWGPRIKRYPIYIYEYVGREEKEHPERDRLQTVVNALLERRPEDYTPRSWEDFDAALKAAQELLKPDPTATEADCTAALADLRNAGDRLVPIAALLTDPVPSGNTEKQPFIADTVGGSKNFRSPSLVSLPGGALLAAADARWDHADPAKGVDTAFSCSTDNGENWTYSFPNFFADSVNRKNAQSSYAAAFTDPAMVTVGDGAVYLLTDVFPGGVAFRSAPNRPADATGCAEIGGVQRLLVYEENIDDGQTDSNYDYYVGDFSGGYADLYDTANHKTLYYVDRYYNLYRREKDVQNKVPENDKLHCRQWDGSDPYGAKYVQQNLFFYSSDFHVRGASYLWLMKGTYTPGAGFTWEPTILNPQAHESGDGAFLGVGPGRGTVTESGHIVLPVYTGAGDAADRSGVITSTDGASWTRGVSLADASSEAVPVAVGDTLYLFARHSNNYYVSTDNGATWSAAKPTGAAYNADCQLSAIHYSQKLNGKDVILLSAPAAADSYADGKIFVFLVEEGGDLTLKRECPVTGSYFGYSCLTELASGDVALLYESSARSGNATAGVTFVTVPKEDVIPAVTVTQVALTVGESKTFPVPENSAVTNSDNGVVTAAVTGAALTLTGAAVGTADVVVDDLYLYHVTVTAADSGNTGNTGGNHRPARPQPPVEPVAPGCPQDGTCPIADYADADPKAWYHDGVHYCIEAGLMTGYGNGLWGPGDTLTRAMLVQILYNRAGKPAVTEKAPFTDVSPNAWYAGAVAWAAAEGIVEGYGDGTFAPERPISRQDAVLILYRLAGKPAAGEDALEPFADRDAVGTWAVEAMRWAVEQGLILGKGDASLSPQHHATRAEAAAILHRHFG